MNMLYFLTVVMMMKVGAPCRADQPPVTLTDQTWLQQLNEQRGHDQAAYRDDAWQIIDNVKTAPLSCAADNVGHSQQRQQFTSSSITTANTPHDDRYPRLLVFVSSSMPLTTLKQLGQEVHRQGGKLVFRGLINNSFKEMAAFLQQLGHEALIDPTLFTALNVQTVPTFVLLSHAPHSLDKLPSYDRLQGNVSLTYALEKFGSKGQTDENAAQQQLIKIKVKP